MREGESPSRLASELESSEAGFSLEYSGLLAAVFPLFDELTKKVPLPDWMCWVVEMWALLQTMTMALWLRNDLVWAEHSQTVQIVFYITTFCPRTPSDSDLMLTVIIVVAIVALILILVTFQAIHYYNYCTFLAASLYPTQIVLELIPNVILGPLSMTTGSVLVTIAEGGAATQYYIFCVLMPLLYIFNAVIFYVAADFLNT
jgi:hypothetical protein